MTGSTRTYSSPIPQICGGCFSPITEKVLAAQPYKGGSIPPKRNAVTDAATSKPADIFPGETHSRVKRNALALRRIAPGSMAMAGYKIPPHPTSVASFKNASPNKVNNAGAKGKAMSEGSKVPRRPRAHQGMMSINRSARKLTPRQMYICMILVVFSGAASSGRSWTLHRIRHRSQKHNAGNFSQRAFSASQNCRPFLELAAQRANASDKLISDFFSCPRQRTTSLSPRICRAPPTFWKWPSSVTIIRIIANVHLRINPQEPVGSSDTARSSVPQ